MFAARLSHHVTVQDGLHLIKVYSISDVFTGPGLEVDFKYNTGSNVKQNGRRAGTEEERGGKNVRSWLPL